MWQKRETDEPKPPPESHHHLFPVRGDRDRDRPHGPARPRPLPWEAGPGGRPRPWEGGKGEGVELGSRSPMGPPRFSAWGETDPRGRRRRVPRRGRREEGGGGGGGSGGGGGRPMEKREDGRDWAYR